MELYVRKYRLERAMSIPELSAKTKKLDPTGKGVSITCISEMENQKYKNVSLNRL